MGMRRDQAERLEEELLSIIKSINVIQMIDEGIDEELVKSKHHCLDRIKQIVSMYNQD